MIDVESARKLLDFSTRIGEQRGEEQLQGAVAVHNILDEHGVAYLADEVGMGKTYVALGTLAIFRHLNPNFRALIIAPRENIQSKWMKEFRIFVRNNYRVSDLRVKGTDQRPVRPLVFCNNLLELARETALDPNRDFFARFTSFSLAVGGKGSVAPDNARRLRDGLRDQLPWIPDAVFDRRSKAAFKDNFAKALCCALPPFDLVIIDEAHNLKHGFSHSASARNRVLGLALGRDPQDVDTSLFRSYGRRARRVLMLSATPIDETYEHLWNQLNVFGRTKGFSLLKSDDVAEAQKKDIAQKLLIRRVTAIQVGTERLTKNLYRREWRGGGVSDYDNPIDITDSRQRLTVALVQKKVSELLHEERFKASFQIGMLASFESFLQTAKLKNAEAEQTFDDADQADNAAERDGVDVADVNRLASSYRSRFNAEMPHPKMDKVVDELASSWGRGHKALIFVRRVASVKELKRKLDERYDQWLLEKLVRDLPQSVQHNFGQIIKHYRSERQKALERDRDLEVDQNAEVDPGGADTFFAWFFRGDGPKGVVSGANVQQRFLQAGAVYSTFFEDNYASAILGCEPGEVEIRLASALGLDRHALRQDLQERSARFLPRVKKLARADRFQAVQAAAIEALRDHKGPHQDLAQVIWDEREGEFRRLNHALSAPDIGDWLELPTFFTRLRQRPELRAALWPEPVATDLREGFREQEMRRQLLSTTARLGHGLIDLYVITIQRLGSLKLRTRETGRSESDNTESGAIEDYLKLLDRQRTHHKSERDWAAFDELAEVSKNFDLIIDVNVPDARDQNKRLSELATDFARLLRKQQPIGGMAGEVNRTLVRQFRMPGYPLVLITTDLMQEGEDLHTFCSDIYHYGIAWKPSAMEQRIGRIDRVLSQTDRRLSALEAKPNGAQKLQVYVPYLQDTVEVLQVRRVLGRMDTFLRLMHESLTIPGKEEHRINTQEEFQRYYRPTTMDTQPLKSSFPVEPHLDGPPADIEAVADETAQLIGRFHQLREINLPGLPIRWEVPSSPSGALYGTAHLGDRIQPFVLLLDLYAGRPRIRCISPVGQVHPDEKQDEIIESAWQLKPRIGAILELETETYDLTVQEDVLLGATAKNDADRLQALLTRVVKQADRLEREFLPEHDRPLEYFVDDIEKDRVRDR